MYRTDRTAVRGFAAFLVIVGAGAAFTVGTHVGADAARQEVTEQQHQTTDAPRIEEDDPRWDCATMGNRQCGPADVNL